MPRRSTCLAIFGLTILASGSVDWALGQEYYRGTPQDESTAAGAVSEWNSAGPELSPHEKGTTPDESVEQQYSLEPVLFGYDDGFVLAAPANQDLSSESSRFELKINGWGQLRQTVFRSDDDVGDLNQFQLKRARIVGSGFAFTQDFRYYIQIDGRSSSGDTLRLLDYYLTYDLGHHALGWNTGRLGFRTGRYKMPFHLSRWLSGREFEFTDRSVASTFFDVNRSLAWGLYGQTEGGFLPLNWETAIFNGLVTGGAETGSSGTLDNNFAYSGRVYAFPTGDWGSGELADFEHHRCLATRAGAGFAATSIDRAGSTEFSAIRVVDSGATLESLLPVAVNTYDVNLFSIDSSFKYRGWSGTAEVYFRSIGAFDSAQVPDLFDHGYWLQLSKFAVPGKLQLISRWSRVIGNSGSLGLDNQSADEISGGFVWYFRGQHAKFTLDITRLDGAPIDSSSLDIAPGANGTLFRSQIQFAF